MYAKPALKATASNFAPYVKGSISINKIASVLNAQILRVLNATIVQDISTNIMRILPWLKVLVHSKTAHAPLATM